MELFKDYHKQVLLPPDKNTTGLKTVDLFTQTALPHLRGLPVIFIYLSQKPRLDFFFPCVRPQNLEPGALSGICCEIGTHLLP